MKTDAQALKEWTLDEIHFDPGKKLITVFKRDEFRHLCRAIREHDDFLVIRAKPKPPHPPVPGATVSLPDMITSKKVLHWGYMDRLKKVIPFMTRLDLIRQPEWTVKFESLLELIEWFEADVKRTDQRAIENGWPKREDPQVH
jgi:hypothetical protein